jgi:hypothetical protein
LARSSAVAGRSNGSFHPKGQFGFFGLIAAKGRFGAILLKKSFGRILE